MLEKEIENAFTRPLRPFAPGAAQPSRHRLSAGQPDGTFSTHAVLAGERVAWRVSRVWATGTTATGIEGFA